MDRVFLSIIHNRMKRGTALKPVSIELRFTCGSKRKYLSTGIKVTPAHWSSTNNRVIRDKNAAMLNAQLDVFVEKAKNVVMEMNKHDITDLGEVDRLMAGASNRGMGFIAYCEKRSKERNVCEHTKVRYKVFTEFLKKYGKIKQFSDVSVSCVRDLNEHLHALGLKQSTIYNYHKYLKLFINDAIVDGLLDKNPYKTLPFQIGKGEKAHVDCITEEQFNAIKRLRLESPHISKARDLFLFQCYTGLAYSDLMSFDYGNCEETKDGKLFYHAKRTKTDTDFVFQILGPARELLDKYGHGLPKMSNQKYNDYLKIVGEMVGVRCLHSHMGRATAATLFLSKGMPLNIVAKVLGHTNIRQTQRYARTLNKDVRSAFDDLEGKI